MILAGFGWLLLAFPYFEQTRNANEIPRLIQAMAIVDGGTFAIDGPEARNLPLGPDVSRNEETGRLYPNKAPGTSLALTGAYWVARQAVGDELDLRTYTFVGRLVVGIVPTVLLGLVLFRRYAPSLGRLATAGAVLMYVVGTPAASYAHLAYGHQLAACLLAMGVVCVVDATESDRPGLALLGGLSAGCAVAVEYGAVFAGLPIGFALVFGYTRSEAGRVMLASLAGAVVPLIGLAAYHNAAFGSPWTTGYHTVVDASFAAKHGQGLLGLGWPTLEGLHATLTSADGGLLWWSPAVVFALVGLVRAATRVGSFRGEARVWLSLVGLYVLVASSLSFEGGWRIGPRYVVVVLPGVVLGFAAALQWARERVMLQPLIVAVAVYSLTVNALAATLWPHMDLTNVHQPVAEVLLPLWGSEHEPYGALRMLGVGGAATVAVVLAVGGALALFARVWHWDARSGAAAGAGLAVGVGLVWGTTWVEPHPRGDANLRYIQRVWEPPTTGAVPVSVGLPVGPRFRALTPSGEPIVPEPPRGRAGRGG